jgi:hypothetical protein
MLERVASALNRIADSLEKQEFLPKVVPPKPQQRLLPISDYVRWEDFVGKRIEDFVALHGFNGEHKVRDICNHLGCSSQVIRTTILKKETIGNRLRMLLAATNPDIFNFDRGIYFNGKLATRQEAILRRRDMGWRDRGEDSKFIAKMMPNAN